MKVLAVMGSYRKGGTIDTVTDEILAGARSTGAAVEKIALVDQNIGYCRNCFTCFGDLESDIGSCPQKDDAQALLEKIVEADGLVLASSINMGSVTAMMKAFMERSCWTLCRPTGRFLWIKGVPESRIIKRKRAVIVTSAGWAPRLLKFVVSYSEYQLAGAARHAFNADVVGTLFVGSIRTRQLKTKELMRAQTLGRLVAAPDLPLAYRLAARIRSAVEPYAETLSSHIRL